MNYGAATLMPRDSEGRAIFGKKDPEAEHRYILRPSGQPVFGGPIPEWKEITRPSLNIREGMHTVLKEICDEYDLVLSREAPHKPEAFVVWELHEDKLHSEPLVRVRLSMSTKERVFFGFTQHDNIFACALAGEIIRDAYTNTGRADKYHYLGDLPY